MIQAIIKMYKELTGGCDKSSTTLDVHAIKSPNNPSSKMALNSALLLFHFVNKNSAAGDGAYNFIPLR